MKINWARIVATWVVLLLIEVFGAYSFWLRLNEPWKQNPDGPASHTIYILLISFAPLPAIMVALLTPAWIAVSCLRVKRAIDSAFKNDFDAVRSTLFTHGWIIFPQPRYAEIIEILRRLCDNRKRRPEGMSPKFYKDIVLDDWGNYVLSWEGKDKMIQTVELGWLNAKQAEDFSSPKSLRILMRLVLIVAIIRGIVLLISLFFSH